MATHSKTEKMMLRQATPGKPTPDIEPKGETVPEPEPEPIAQWESTRGDRFVYLLWLACFALMAVHILVESLLGFFFMKR